MDKKNIISEIKLVLENESPFMKGYKKEKISIYKLKTAKSMLNKLHESALTKNIECGKIYILTYTSNNVETDKWHRICIVYVTEIKPHSFIAYNILYFSEDASLWFLKKAIKRKGYDFSAMSDSIALKNFNLDAAKKEYYIDYIQKIVEINEEEWHLLPTIKKSVFGNLNAEALIIDWEKENRQPLKQSIKKKTKIQNSQENEASESLTYEHYIGASGSATLEDIKADLFNDDDDI